MQVVWAHHARCFARQQMNYIMGSTGHSFVTDWGFNPPEKPHHRPASCGYVLLQEECDLRTWDDTQRAFPNVLTGALVGGPNLYDEWEDNHLDFVASEVALDYNAALLSGVLLHICMPTNFQGCSLYRFGHTSQGTHCEKHVHVSVLRKTKD